MAQSGRSPLDAGPPPVDKSGVDAADFSGRGGMTDPLTGLCDRHALRRTGAVVVDRARAHGDGVSAACVLVDGLGDVQRACGRDAVDEVLMVVAQALRDLVGPDDVVARLGGAGFAVVTEGAGDPAEVLEVRLLCRLQQISPLDDGTWDPTVSVGCAVLDPWDDGDLDTLLTAAAAEIAANGGA